MDAANAVMDQSAAETLGLRGLMPQEIDALRAPQADAQQPVVKVRLISINVPSVDD